MKDHGIRHMMIAAEMHTGTPKSEAARRAAMEMDVPVLTLSAISRAMKRLAKAQKLLARKQARAQKELERHAYDWASMGY